MLDVIIKTEIPLISKAEESNNSQELTLTGCKVVHYESGFYSIIDDLNFYRLNSNDYNLGRIDIELSFQEEIKNPYTTFEFRCITFQTDLGVARKIKGVTNLHKFSSKSYTKVSKDGKLVLGISYYFPDEETKNGILNCKAFALDGFFCLGSKRNVYSFSCATKKVNDNWILDVGNTSKIYKFTHINNLMF